MHYYRFNIKNWNDATSHLSLVEQAVYFKLINFYYDKEQPIPLDTKPVIRKLMLSGFEAALNQVLDEFFYKSDGGYRHRVCDKAIRAYQKNANKNKANGVLGGRPRLVPMEGKQS